MDTEKIRQLLEKYYNAECSEDEEMQLRKIFEGEEIPDEFHCEREIFGYYSHASEIPEPASDFVKSIIEAVDDENIKRINVKKRFIMTVAGIAAGLAILTGTLFFLKGKREPRDTYSDPEIAYTEAMKIMQNVSARMNHGTKALGHIAMMQEEARKSFMVIGEPANIIEHKMRPLNNLNKAMVLINKGDGKQ